MSRLVAAALLALLLLLPSPSLQAAPVEWVEVPATSEGQQWWDRGSLRLNRRGELTVLSRFTPAAEADSEQRPGQLYVMAIDCGAKLYRDLQVNGLPRLGGDWEIAADDALISTVMQQVCSEAHERGLA
ncbi:MAG: hypothetical protein VKJ87_01140 [Synechococcus sp.]|nr:hypothetical protein [Synechococcus sp.]